MKRLILYLFLGLALISCDKNELGNTVDYTLIGKGELYGNENIEESQIVVNDSISWHELKAGMDLVSQIPDEFDSGIDFETEELVAIFDKVRGRTDYSFRIKKIEEFSNEVVVFYEQNITEGGYTIVNQPFIIIKIPKTGKEITFNKRQVPFNLN